MIRYAILPILIAAAAVGCRPEGEVVRYMARPPAKVRPAPQDGTYLLFPGINDPAILVEELRAGEPIGFRLIDTPQGGRALVAVVGDDQTMRLDRGERYAWMLQSQMQNMPAAPGVEADATAAEQRLAAARRALEQAQAELERAQQSYTAAQRRFEEAQQAAEQD